MPRTEADMVSKAPIKVRLGEKEYKIPVLTILPSREWRIKLNDEMAGVVEAFKPVENSDSTAFGRGLASALIGFPEKMADLVFAYAGATLSKEEILKEASEEQIGTAFSAIMEVAYPLVPLAQAMKAARENPPATARYTN